MCACLGVGVGACVRGSEQERVRESDYVYMQSLIGLSS